MTAEGTVESVTTSGDEWEATCPVWLERGEERVVTGSAQVAGPGAGSPA